MPSKEVIHEYFLGTENIVEFAHLIFLQMFQFIPTGNSGLWDLQCFLVGVGLAVLWLALSEDVVWLPNGHGRQLVLWHLG